MLDYRAYILGRDGILIGVRRLQCADDQAAIAAARPFVDGHDVEVWHESRMLAHLAHSDTTNETS
jgi:hypothetical protein